MAHPKTEDKIKEELSILRASHRYLNPYDYPTLHRWAEEAGLDNLVILEPMEWVELLKKGG